MKFEVVTTGKDKLLLVCQLQAFADGYWLPDHVTEDQAAAIILDAFRRKMLGQLELLDLRLKK